MHAFGMVVYEVIMGVSSRRVRRLLEIPALNIQGSRPYRPKDPTPVGFGQGTWEFAERCWDENQTQRPSAGAALEHFERVARTSTTIQESGASLTTRPDFRVVSQVRFVADVVQNWRCLPPIEFEVLEGGVILEGISLKDALDMGYSRLDGRDDGMFTDESIGNSVSLRMDVRDPPVVVKSLLNPLFH